MLLLSDQAPLYPSPLASFLRGFTAFTLPFAPLTPFSDLEDDSFEADSIALRGDVQKAIEEVLKTANVSDSRQLSLNL